MTDEIEKEPLSLNPEQLNTEQQQVVNYYVQGFSAPSDTREEDLELADLYALELGGEEVAQALKRIAYNAYAHAKAMRDQSLAQEVEQTRSVSVDLSRIGWTVSNETQSFTAVEMKGKARKPIFMADLTGINNTTKDCYSELDTQNEKDGTNVREKLLESLSENIVPQLYENIKSGRQVRLVHVGNGRDGNRKERFVKTTFSAYKEDVLGTKNRAVLLLLEDREGYAVFGLAALYDHDDDKLIHRALKAKRQRG